ncbi:MAG: HypC/HybG/HupF family hydrogenase formation chaperone [Acidobacteriota bacterium]
MCLAVPMKLTTRDDFTGVVELDGIQREVSLMLLPEAEIGDYLLIHAGYAIGRVDEAEALETIEVLRSAADLMGPV